MAKKKFKAIEKNAEIKSKFSKDYVGDIEWEGEELMAQSQTKLEQDIGVGAPVIIRFFEFGTNPQAFRDHTPSAQELFDSHRRGIETLLWTDGLKPLEGIEPRFMFSKDKSHYRFIVTCIPRLGESIIDTPRTLTQLIK
jgi:hypothetical protein